MIDKDLSRSLPGTRSRLLATQSSSSRLINSITFGSQRRLQQDNQLTEESRNVHEGVAIINGPLEWHEFLREAEAVRRADISAKIRQNKIHLQCLHELLQQSMNETAAAFRLTAGLALAHERLSLLLLDRLGASSSSETEETQVSQSKENYRSRSTDIGNNVPPISSIAVPESDVVSLMETQSLNFQHKMAKTVTYQKHAAERIKEMQEISVRHANKLDDRSKEIINELESTEDRVQLAWESYYELASIVLQTKAADQPKKFASSKKTPNDNDKYTIGNVWLAELRYRSAVSQQLDEWVKKDSILQFNFILVKDAECQRRIRLRQYLHSTLHKQQSAFGTSAVDVGSEDDWLLENNNDLDNDDLSANSDHGLWAEIDSEIETQLSHIMNKQSQDALSAERLVDSTSLLASRPSALYKTRMKMLKQKEEQLRQRIREQKAISESNESTTNGRHFDDSRIMLEGDDCSLLNIDKTKGKVEKNEDRSGRGASLVLESIGKMPLQETIQERIQRVADKSGAVSFWNPSSNYNLDQIVDFSLAHTIKPKASVPITSDNPKIGVSPDKQEVDPASLLLYAGALLESQYVQFATVVELVVEESDTTFRESKERSSFVQKISSRVGVQDNSSEHDFSQLCLAVVTSDEIVHLFDVPELSFDDKTNENTIQGGILKVNKLSSQLKVGSKPEDALHRILQQQQQDHIANEKTSKKGLFEDRSKNLDKKQIDESDSEVDGIFNFALSPILSISLNDYTIRMTKRRGFGVKLTKNMDVPNKFESTSTTSSAPLTLRLKVSSNKDQLALVAAARNQLSRMEL